MKRHTCAGPVFIAALVGILIGSTGRFLRTAQLDQASLRAQYRRGFLEGELKVYGEAIRHGHGGWSLDGKGGKVFAWNDGHPNWTPDRPQTEPIDRVFKE